MGGERSGVFLQNVKLVVAYDGTNYHGFAEQRGAGLPTVQEVLEKCLSRLAGKKITVVGAARTDAGVHAEGQVVSFFLPREWAIPVQRIPLALNGLLPEDVAALRAQKVPFDFHARFSARAKTYRYTVHNSRVPSPFLKRYSHFEPRALNVADMSAAACYLVGRHDFASFRAAGSSAKTTVRTLFSAAVEKKGELVYFTFRGDGFLYNMVRIMVGTLLEVGLGKRRPEEVAAVLAAKDRTAAGPTVPARGLCLLSVEYPPDG